MRAKKNSRPLLSAANPDLFAQLCLKKNNGEELKTLRTGSNKYVWWICPENSEHIWDDYVAHRALENRGCPYCSGKRVNHTNSLLALNPGLADELHPSRNHPDTEETLYAHSGKKVWWKCKNGHEYPARISNRNPKNGSAGTGCKKCSWQTSLPEIRIYAELKFLFPDAEWRPKFHDIEIDILVPSLKVGIEYDGAYWHSKKSKKDKEKNLIFEKMGWNLVRVREAPLEKIGKQDIILIDPLGKRDMNSLIELLMPRKEEQKKSGYLKSNDFLNREEYNRVVGLLPSPIPEKSLAAVYP